MKKGRIPELQNLYRDEIIKRFNNCIVSNMHYHVCEAAHIIPFSESNYENCYDIDNGLLLNSILHKLFDNYDWSINPETYCIEIFNKTPDIYNIMKEYNGKYINILNKYSNIIKYITNHYKISIKKF
jgi:alpha-N-acetylglucosamine transferase